MKQILKYGKYNITTCGSCGCEFAFEKTDIVNDNKVTCPCCGAECTAQVKA